MVRFGDAYVFFRDKNLSEIHHKCHKRTSHLPNALAGFGFADARGAAFFSESFGFLRLTRITEPGAGQGFCSCSRGRSRRGPTHGSPSRSCPIRRHGSRGKSLLQGL